MKELTLDFAKWRCGGDEPGPNVLGEGATQMLNKQGFYCCLGLFSKQLREDITDEVLLGIGQPGDVSEKIGVSIPLLSIEEEYYDSYDCPVISFTDTCITDEAIEINDDPLTTPEDKIRKLRELFGEEGYTIKVINKP